MITYTIYHIPGVKVGCTMNFERRCTEYSSGTVIEILEQVRGKTKREVGDIEWDWADKFGYPRGHHYGSYDFGEMGKRGGAKGGKQTVNRPKEWFSEHGRKRGKISGAKYVERTTSDKRIQLARVAALKQREVTPVDKQIEIAKKGGRRSVELKAGIHARTPAQVSIDSSKGAIRILELGLTGTQRRAQCPHCGLESNIASLGRWHFDNCKHRKLLTEGYARG